MRWGGVSERRRDGGLDAEDDVNCVTVSDGSIIVSVVRWSRGDADAVGGNTVASGPRETTGVVGEDWSS